MPNNLETRSRVIRLTRDFFHQNGYLEVETPIKGPAVIPEAHIDPVKTHSGQANQSPQFLQASPELYMKRLLSQGIPKIFQICKSFRSNERGERHLPELTLLEWYGAHETYEDLMDQCQGLVRHIAQGLGTGTKLVYHNRSIDLATDFERLSVSQAFRKYGSQTMEQALASGRFDEIVSFEIEPHLGLERPCILYDYPAPMASLARLKPGNPNLAQRFELYVSGIELANGFTELTDAKVQRERFEKENQIRADQGLTPLPLPEKFLIDLASMPEAAGIALGMDRLVMLFCDADAIDDVVAFTPENQ